MERVPPVDTATLRGARAVGIVCAVAFLAPVTLMMHNFWAVTDPMMHQLQMVMFLKNLALIGGALTFAVHGAGAYSLDARVERRAGITRPAQLAV